jgi:hypothetical protein
MKYSIKIVLIFLFLSLFFIAGCKKETNYEQNGWVITSHLTTNTLSISKEGLKIIADQVQLNMKRGNDVIMLSDWKVTQKDDELIINTKKPKKTTWQFHIFDSAIDVVCSCEDGLITAVVPAGEMRIPVRISSQDNGIIYTQMGFVSATNIYNLFDMQTDIMISFAKGSKLKRNKDDNKLMDIQLPVAANIEFSIIENYYSDVIGLSKYQKTDFKPVYKHIPGRFKTAPTGWSSWYSYYLSATQEDIAEEANVLSRKLKPYGLEYVQIDEGFTMGEYANHLEWNKDRFPKGGKWLFQYIKEKGLKPGLHVNAYGANNMKPECADKYPEDYFLHDKYGNLSEACCSDDQTRLDYTNPEVIEKHLKPLFNTLVNEWNLSYLKSAGWGKWMDYYNENREKAYNPKIDSREAYQNVQATIREIMGDNNYIVGCAMHEIGIGFGIYDGSRTGSDDYANWTGEGHWSRGMHTFFNSLFGTNWLNGICWWSDPDDVMIRDPLTMDEAQTIISSISLSGQAYIISDFIAEFSKERLNNFLNSDVHIGWAEQYPDKIKALPEDKLLLYRRTMPAMPIKAMDLYPFRTDPVCCPEPEEFPRTFDLKVNSKSGIYDVVALYNWENEKKEKIIHLQQDLGLKNGTDYLVFDYWNNKLLGIYNEIIREKIPAHGTKALIIKKVTENPQLVATSRHLTAAYSILEMNWNTEDKFLSGISKTVTGDRYILFIYVPENYKYKKVEINAENVKTTILSDNILEVGFMGKEESVKWKIIFNI